MSDAPPAAPPVPDAPSRTPRAGWAEDARPLAQAGGDGLAWPEFRNAGDADLRW